MASEKSDYGETTHTIVSDHLNNVTKMDAQGNRTALCICGKEFQAGTHPLTVERGDETFYCCSLGCHEMMIATVPAAREELISGFWAGRFPYENLMTNVHLETSPPTATCLCGTSVAVKSDTPTVAENGLKLYLCSDACGTALHGMSAADRMNLELKNIEEFQTRAADVTV